MDADAPITIALEQDYSTRPFDDPGLIGKGVPIEVALSAFMHFAMDDIRCYGCLIADCRLDGPPTRLQRTPKVCLCLPPRHVLPRFAATSTQALSIINFDR